jgi:hypothetical protein
MNVNKTSVASFNTRTFQIAQAISSELVSERRLSSDVTIQ